MGVYENSTEETPILIPGADFSFGLEIDDLGDTSLVPPPTPVPVVLDETGDYINIICRLKIDSYSTIFAKFSREVLAGYITLKKISSTRYDVIIDSSITKTLQPGYARLGVNLISTDADTQILDDKWNDLFEIQKVFRVVAAETEIGQES